MTLAEETITQEVAPSTEPKLEVVESTDEYGRIVVEPLLRGFGVTLGNAMRRVLLGSLTGAAVTWVRIDGIQHEYTTIPKVKEDVAEVLLNVKGVRIRPLAHRPGSLRLEVKGPGQVTGGDIQPSADFEVVNTEQHLASVDEKGTLSVEFHVELGKGYLPAAHTEGMPIGVLPVDAVFTPVRKVNYAIENTRVGQVTDFERLVLEVWTDGTKTPQEAVREAAQILVDSFFQFVAVGQAAEAGGQRQSLAHAIPADQYNMPIERLELGARTLNCLKRAKINKVGEVLEKSREELLKIKNFGEKSLAELYEHLQAKGIRLVGVEAEAPAAAAQPAAAEQAVAEEGAAPAPAPAEKRERPRRKETIKGLSDLRAVLLGAEAAGGEKEESQPGVAYLAELAEEEEEGQPEAGPEELGEDEDLEVERRP